MPRLDPKLTGFGDFRIVEENPRVQIHAAYGLRETDVDVEKANGGTAVGEDSLFKVTSGLGIGGYGVIRSERVGRYQPGNPLLSRFTAAFPVAGVANSLQVAGLFTSVDALFVGYVGEQFGITRRIPGRVAAWRLTVTAPAVGEEDITITLDGVAQDPVTVPALSSAAQIAQLLAAATPTGWTSRVSPMATGATVTYLQNTPAATGTDFTFASDGAATGTFAMLAAGAPNDDTTNFVPQSAWNVNDCSGNGGPKNPGGIRLEPENLNVYNVQVPYLGAGSVIWYLTDDEKNVWPIHVDRYAGHYQVPSARNPVYSVGWVAASLGSTGTDLTVHGSSGAIAMEGQYSHLRNPTGAERQNFTAGITPYVFLAVRVRGEFQGLVDQREVVPMLLSIANETANKAARMALVLNPTFSSPLAFSYVDQAESVLEYATPTAVQATGGRLIVPLSITGATLPIDLRALDIRLRAGDVLALVTSTASATAVLGGGITCHEI